LGIAAKGRLEEFAQAIAHTGIEQLGVEGNLTIQV
jgi:hypothetical protein